MEFNIQKDSISLCETSFQGSGEYAVDCDITLPEYLPDIIRILRCTCVPSIQSHQINGDRINSECDCLVRVLYICEQGKIRCFEQNMHFTKQIELKSAEPGDALFVGAKTDYVNYRVSGQRRFEVHGAVTVFAKSDCKKKYELVTDAVGDGITLKRDNEEICNLVCTIEKPFFVTETCDAGSLSEPIGSIISSCAFATIDELKIVSNKLFLKGELIVHTTFTGADSGDVYNLENRININQIIEAPEVTEECHIDSCLQVIGLQIKSRFDPAGNKNLLDISANINISVSGYETRNIPAVKDAYSVKYETDVKKSVMYARCLEEKLEDTFLCRGIAELSSSGISKVLSFICTDISSAFSINEDSISVSGEVNADIIYEDSKGEICFAQRQIPYEYKKSVSCNSGILICKPCCTPTAYNYVLNDGTRLDVRIEINIRGFIFCEKEKLITTQLSVNKDKPKTIKTASLTVYFAEGGEQLWNIAERYNTTVDAIMRENRLSEPAVKEKCKLLIPKM